MRENLKRKGLFQLLVRDHFHEICLRKIMKIHFSSWSSDSEFLERSAVLNTEVRIAEIPLGLVGCLVKVQCA